MAQHVHMSPIELEQVFVNLLRNAVESRERGALVEIAARRRGGLVCIDVRDDGRGIAEDARGHLFDPFYTSRLGQGGTGLGLSVAHGIVEAHDGRVHVASKPGAGTLVTVELPLAASSDDAVRGEEDDAGSEPTGWGG